MNIPNEFTTAQFQNGNAEASELGLPPGVAPTALKLERKGQFYSYQFSRRKQDADGDTTAWVYSKVSPDAPFATISILND